MACKSRVCVEPTERAKRQGARKGGGGEAHCHTDAGIVHLEAETQLPGRSAETPRDKVEPCRGTHRSKSFPPAAIVF